MPKAVILLAGGIDSTTTLALAKNKGFECYALSFDYSQRHLAELTAARKIAQHLGVKEHKILTLDLSLLTTSALTNHSLDVPLHGSAKGITSSYVPARNTIFLSYALAWAEVIGAYDIFYGGCMADNSGFPDCRPEYVAAFEQLANLATKDGVEGKTITIHAPLVDKSKAETLLMGQELGVDYSLTITCYCANEHGHACGVCESCVARKQGFAKAKLKDITSYIT